MTWDSLDMSNRVPSRASLLWGLRWGTTWLAALVCVVANLASVEPVFAQAGISNNQVQGFIFFLGSDEAISTPIVRGPLSLNKEFKAQVLFGELLILSNSYTTQRSAIRPGFRTNSASPPLPTLSSSTPFLPFLGNPLVISSYVPNAPTVADATAAYGVALARQPDCSITEDYLLPAATPSAGIIASVPAAQDYLHQLAGLSTTGDVFANGCTNIELGLPSRFFGTVKVTSASKAVGASAENGLVITVGDSTANTLTNATLLSSSVLQGYMNVADVNGDGNDDIIATFVTDPATQQQSTAVFLGNGDGTFKTPVYYDVPGDVTIDDVNGDGKPDIVVCGSTPGVTSLLGRGDGTFTVGPVSATTITACAQAPGQILTGDFNNDGKKDLLVHGVVLQGSGDGTFTVASPVTTSTNFLWEFGNTAVGDVNKDGKADVVVSQPGFVAVYYGNGNGTFTAGPRYAGLPGVNQVSITDIDGDGNPDIVNGSTSPGLFSEATGDSALVPLLQILMGRGDGTFVDSVAYEQGSYGGYGPQILSADFTGDGKPDVLAFNRNADGTLPSSLVVLPGDGTGALGTAILSSVNNTPTMAVTADMNKDGQPDVVVAGTFTAGPVLSVLTNQGGGVFANEQDYALPDPPVSLAAGDFNGDGLIDIAVGVNPGLGKTGPSGVYILYGQANGTLAAPVQIDASLDPTGIVVADLNGDGRADLIVADQGFLSYVGSPQQVNGALHVYLGSSGGVLAPATAPTTTATNYTVAAVADLNADGKPDLIVAGNIAGSAAGSGTPTLYTLLGNGDGTFQTAVALPLAAADGIGPTSIAVADFNKDGHTDVALANPNDFTEVLFGDGTGALNESILGLGQQPSAVAAADLNGDGYPELIEGANNGSPTLTVFRNSNVWAAAATLPATTTTLATSATSISAGESITLTATVAAAAGSTVPTGTVTFLDGATTLGTGSLGTSGTATLTVSTLSAGSHSLTASYGGSSSYAASMSSAVTVVATAGSPDYTVALSPLSGTVGSGQSATTTVTLTPSNGFSGTVSLSCSGLPIGASCRFSAAAVTVNGTAATSTLTIATAAASAANRTVPPVPLAPGGGVLLAGIGLPLVARRRRFRGRWQNAVVLGIMVMGSVSLLHGCGDGGGGGNSGDTAPGSYTVTVTATSGSTTHSAAYALTVN